MGLAPLQDCIQVGLQRLHRNALYVGNGENHKAENRGSGRARTLVQAVQQSPVTPDECSRYGPYAWQNVAENRLDLVERKLALTSDLATAPDSKGRGSNGREHELASNQQQKGSSR